MGKRQLNEDEKKFAEKTLKKVEEDLEDLKEELSILDKKRTLQETIRELEDALRPFNRKITDKQLNGRTKEVQVMIKTNESTLTITRDQIRYGVEEIKQEEKEDE